MKIKFIYLIISLTQLELSLATCSKPCTNSSDCKGSYLKGEFSLNYFSSFPIDITNSCVAEVLIVIHGADRNIKDYFSYANQAVSSENLNEFVLVWAPHFKTIEDNPNLSEYYWTDSGWKQGNISVNGKVRRSSFEMLDSIIKEFFYRRDLFPNLKQIVITGHSAGGQYVQRYAFSTTIDSQENLPEGVAATSYIVQNPSSYLYLNEMRPDPDDQKSFVSPTEASYQDFEMKPEFEKIAGNCPDTYHNYKYGLYRLNDYLKKNDLNLLKDAYKRKDIYYMLGEMDQGIDNGLDITCSALTQGANRHQRGNAFYHFMDHFFSEHTHKLIIVPGVGHNGKKMMNSSDAKQVYFKLF